MTSPDFSPLAERYAQSRPRYPTELFFYLASLVERHECAWDCATGNGQAARDLVRFFKHVVATDVSIDQIRHATATPGIEYLVASAEHLGIREGSVDLVTVAAAIHWFDIAAFTREVRRVLRPGGVLAVWSYHVGMVAPPFDQVFGRLYWEILRPYFAPEVGYVDERYTTVPLPGMAIEPPDFSMEVSWNYLQVTAFIQSWSGTKAYVEAHGENPMTRIEKELKDLWGDPARRRRLRWPLFFRIQRIIRHQAETA